MGCSHREGCPLFPLLKESLRGWRDYYCDHEDRWADCSRYKLSLAGKLVPITLLPSGYDAQYLPDADRSGSLESKHALPLRPTSPSRPNSRAPEPTVAASLFEPSLFEPAPAPAPARPLGPPPAQVLQTPGNPPARSTRPPQRTHGPARGWWTRLTDWMTGPA